MGRIISINSKDFIKKYNALLVGLTTKAIPSLFKTIERRLLVVSWSKHVSLDTILTYFSQLWEFIFDGHHKVIFFNFLLNLRSLLLRFEIETQFKQLDIDFNSSLNLFVQCNNRNNKLSMNYL